MKKIKSIAMYLPQFHQIPENDEWWGEGFTEWVAVKEAHKMFEFQNQPREPLDDNYYSLLNVETLKWQSDLLKEYEVDGLCFYHYYFKDGRKILEKPAELLLKNANIDMPFCFCWANVSWARTWSKLREKNMWSIKYEEQLEQREDGILLEQQYGREKEWIEHFEYLLPFFKDERYIKLDNKPVILIYAPNDIIPLAEMIECWKKLAIEEGFSGIYIIGENTDKIRNGLDAAMYSGPIAYWNPQVFDNMKMPKIVDGIKCYDYEILWKNALLAKPIDNAKTFYGGFVDYDDTPRQGQRGKVLESVSVDSFEKNIYLLAKKNIQEGNEFLFINAWNEWGEGMYLEPDKVNKYGYLEAIKRVMEKINKEDIIVNPSYGHIITNERTKEERLEENVKKYIEYFNIMGEWLTLKERNIDLSNYLKKHEYKNVAIYGLGIMGEHLIEDLQKNEIIIQYVVDRLKGKIVNGIDKYSLEDELPDTDAIIVTPTYYYDEIYQMLREKLECPIISLLQIIRES